MEKSDKEATKMEEEEEREPSLAEEANYVKGTQPPEKRLQTSGRAKKKKKKVLIEEQVEGETSDAPFATL